MEGLTRKMRNTSNSPAVGESRKQNNRDAERHPQEKIPQHHSVHTKARHREIQWPIETHIQTSRRKGWLTLKEGRLAQNVQEAVITPGQTGKQPTFSESQRRPYKMENPREKKIQQAR